MNTHGGQDGSTRRRKNLGRSSRCRHQGVSREMKETHGEIFPAEFHTHRRAAQREMLLALRALIDAKIERIEKTDRTTPKAARIPVE
jgi:hypothetical protein